MTVQHPAIDELATALDRIAVMGDRAPEGLAELKHKIRVSRDACARRLIKQEAEDPRRLDMKDIETLDKLDIQWAFLESTSHPASQEILQKAVNGVNVRDEPTLATHFRRVHANPALADKIPERVTLKRSPPAPHS